MGFVLDPSVTMRWLLSSPKTADQKYAEKVLRSLVDTQARVPDLWYLEVANVLLGAERRRELVPGESEAFISQLEKLPVQVDSMTGAQAFSRTLGISRACKLSSYDAAYLELAVRESIPLATLDKGLRKAAHKTGVDTYLL